jgi:large subunit ribosomal protein L6e
MASIRAGLAQLPVKIYHIFQLLPFLSHASVWSHIDACINQARKSLHPSRPRPSLQPGTVVILLAGRFRGKRVVLLKHLSEGTLLVTGPFKINGVPLRRVNARYVIATTTKIDLKGVDDKTLDKISGTNYFTKEKKSEKVKSEEAFFKQGEKPEVGSLPSGYRLGYRLGY